jgi:predicted permease
MRLWNKVRSRFGRAGEDGLAEEMRQHREMIEERFRADGMSARDARNRAAREFGPLATAIEDGRAEWSFAWLEALWSDTRYACRALARDKTFAFTAVLTLGAGLALASVAFTFFNAYVLRPFAVTGADRLYAVEWRGKDAYIPIHPWWAYEELRGRTDVVEEALASRGVFVGGSERHWQGTLVSDNYFRMLGARTAIGRPIARGDTDVVVLGHRAWQSAFNGEADVIGKTLVLRGRKYEVIGVAAPEFIGLDESPPDFWAPIGLLRAFRAEEKEIAAGVIVRLREGVSKARAQDALAAMAARARVGLRPHLEPRATALNFEPMVLLVFSPVLLALGLVLATCCANVANMLLARGLARQREIGIRLSVGAGRGRLVRQLMTEALVIATLAGVTGLALAQAALEGGQRLFFATAPIEFTKLVRLPSLAPDYRVFLFALAAAAVAALIAALVPALQATRPSLTMALRGEFGAAFRASRMRDAMVVLQVVVCTVLLACGALLYRRADVFQTQQTGMRERQVISISGDRRGPEFVQELRALPYVEEIAVARRPPWYSRLPHAMVIPAGHTDGVAARYNTVSAGYFEVMAIPVMAGRVFTEEESRTGAPVAVVSQATARAFWPWESPIGKTIRGVESREGLDNLPIRGDLRVVGVTADVRHGMVFDRIDDSCIYLPPGDSQEVLALVRGDEDAGLQHLRQWVVERWPTFEGETLPLSTVLNMQVYGFRAAAWLGWGLGLLAMALTISGMYGVMSFLVSQRSKEIGIRMALGASPGGVVGMVLRRSVKLATLGVAIGGGFAAAALKLLVVATAGIRVVEFDTLALALGVALAGTAAVLAAAGPSSRAARVDPNTVLRSD